MQMMRIPAYKGENQRLYLIYLIWVAKDYLLSNFKRV